LKRFVCSLRSWGKVGWSFGSLLSYSPGAGVTKQFCAIASSEEPPEATR
jgi:hypothetical protein